MDEENSKNISGGEIFKLIYDHFNNSKSKSLIIFDNVEDSKILQDDLEPDAI